MSDRIWNLRVVITGSMLASTVRESKVTERSEPPAYCGENGIPRTEEAVVFQQHRPATSDIPVGTQYTIPLVRIALLDDVIDRNIRFGYRQRSSSGQIGVQVACASEQTQVAEVAHLEKIPGPW